MATRSPVVTIVGHVDHGKTSLLDRIRGTAVAKSEAGGITQCIGCTVVPITTIKKICGPLLESTKLKFTIPGFLFIDSPGHAAFTNLRKRGGALADIAILVIDINEGFKPQTVESIEILKNDKTPFVVVANKVDLVPGWTPHPETQLINNITQQEPHVIEKFETKMYEIVGKLHELGFASERFDRIEDYRKQISIIPTSVVTGEGLPELLMVLAGLAQRYLEQELKIEVSGPAKGTILEIKEEKGLGTTADVIIYDGILNVNDTIVIGGIDKPIITKVRALLEPLPLTEMRNRKAKFSNVKQVTAATSVKISAPELDNVVAGMPLRACKPEDVRSVADEIQKEVAAVVIETDRTGIIIKADTLGSLEAVIFLLRENGIPLRSASIGPIGKKEVAAAEASMAEMPFNGVVLGFNVPIIKEAEEYAASKEIKIILSDIIYRLIDEYKRWKDEKKKAIEMAELNTLVRGGMFRFLPNHTFRQSNPAVIGTDIMSGRIKPGEYVMNKSGKRIAKISSIEEERESVNAAEAGKSVSVAMEDVTVGRQINEGDVFYIDIPEEDFRKMKELKDYLSKSDIELLKEVAEIKRKNNPAWGL